MSRTGTIRSRRGWRLCGNAEWPRCQKTPVIGVELWHRGEKADWSRADGGLRWYPVQTWEEVCKRLFHVPEGLTEGQGREFVIWRLEYDPKGMPANVDRGLFAARIMRYRVERGGLNSLIVMSKTRTKFRAKTPAECVAKLLSYYSGEPLAVELAKVEAELVMEALGDTGRPLAPCGSSVGSVTGMPCRLPVVPGSNRCHLHGGGA